MDADPDHVTELPRWTLTPLALALAIGVMFIVAIFTPWGIPIGTLLAAVVLLAWFWPRRPYRREMFVEDP
jgi:cytochrome c oxidase subunit 1